MDAIFEAHITGITPLLMHNPAGMKPVSATPGRSGKDIPTPEVEAERATYRDTDGQLVIPAIAVQRCIMNAAKQFKDPRNSRATMYRGMAAALYPPEREWFTLGNGNGKPADDYDIDVRRAVVQRAAIMRARPKLFPWSADIAFEYDAELVTDDLLRMVLRLGGKQVGILDYRPEKGGPYGRFSVDD